jgi:hypothetical protein
VCSLKSPLPPLPSCVSSAVFHPHFLPDAKCPHPLQPHQYQTDLFTQGFPPILISCPAFLLRLVVREEASCHGGRKW